MALKPAGRTLSSLTGIVVLVAVLWLLLNFVYAPSCGRFGCSYVPSWWPQADATSTDCPDSLKDAASDAQWAADRIATIAEEKPTVLLAYDEDGTEHRFDSSKDEDEQNVIKTLEELQFPPDKTGRYPAAHHAEAKVAYRMRTTSVNYAVAVINNRKGVCNDDPQSCTGVVRRLLPRGATLMVWAPGDSEPMTLTGGS